MPLLSWSTGDLKGGLGWNEPGWPYATGAGAAAYPRRYTGGPRRQQAFGSDRV